MFALSIIVQLALDSYTSFCQESYDVAHQQVLRGWSSALQQRVEIKLKNSESVYSAHMEIQRSAECKKLWRFQLWRNFGAGFPKVLVALGVAWTFTQIGISHIVNIYTSRQIYRFHYFL